MDANLEHSKVTFALRLPIFHGVSKVRTMKTPLSIPLFQLDRVKKRSGSGADRELLKNG